MTQASENTTNYFTILENIVPFRHEKPFLNWVVNWDIVRSSLRVLCGARWVIKGLLVAKIAKTIKAILKIDKPTDAFLKIDKRLSHMVDKGLNDFEIRHTGAKLLSDKLF